MKEKNISKKERIERLRRILDIPDNENLYPEDEKYLKALSKILKESIEESKEREERDSEIKKLEPTVKVYPRIIKKEETKIDVIQEKEATIIRESKKEVTVKDEEIFEIEKVDVKEKEFIKVKPKEIREEKKEKIEKEWESTEVERPKIRREKEIEWEIVEEELIDKRFDKDKKRHKLKEFIEISEEEKEEKLDFKDLEEKKKEEIEEIEEDLIEEVETLNIDNKLKMDVFKEISSIDNDTAVVLYDNGFTSLESIELASLKDICRLTGINKKLAKKIKKEVAEKLKSRQYKARKKEKKGAFEREEKEDFEEEVILPFKEKPLPVEPIDIGETAEWELTSEDIKEESLPIDYIKISAFKDMKSIDDKTAILLYDNGYTSVEALKRATEEDLKKIKGLKSRQIKKIIREVNEKILESEKIKPLDPDLQASAELTKEDLEIDRRRKKIALTDSLVELHRKHSEWVPVEEELEDGKKEKIVDEIIVEKEEISNEDKINIFKGLNTVDEITAVLLYDGGVHSIEDLKRISIKDLAKINGIGKALAKEIKKELRDLEKCEIEKDEFIKEDYKIPILDEYDEEYELIKFEEDVKDNERRDKKHNVFRGIKSIDEKIAELLVNNGINSIEELKKRSVKELASIKGIGKKLAKDIKKELEKIDTIKEKKKGKGGQYYLKENNKEFLIFDIEEFPEEYSEL